MCLLLNSGLSGQSLNQEVEGLIREANSYLEKNPEKAIALLEKTRQLQPANPSILIRIGFIYYVQKKISQSSLYFKNAVKAAKTSRQKAGYLKVIREITEQFPSRSDYQIFQKGGRLIQEKKPEEALQTLEQLIANNPYNSRLYYLLGFASREMRNLNQAVDYLEKARAVNPMDPDILRQLQLSYAEMGREKQLDRVVDDYTLIYENSPTVLYEIGSSYAKAGNGEKAIKVFEKILKQFPAFPLSYLRLGELYLKKKNDPGKAKPYLEEFLRILKGESQVSDIKQYSYSSQQILEMRIEAEKLMEECRKN
jgi:tetratricopeptide (TPR) repeat protein